MEMTRQRAQESLSDTIYENCPYCGGRGVVLLEYEGHGRRYSPVGIRMPIALRGIKHAIRTAWSPDGRWMYFTAQTLQGSHIWRQAVGAI